MKPWIILGAVALLAMGGLVALVLLDSPADTAGLPALVLSEPEPPAPRPARPAPVRRATPELKAGSDPAARKQDDAPVTVETVQSFGQEFEARWYRDRELLGAERHKEMEQLWFAGRRPRGDPQARENLERLLKEFPDTNRAGCAALELGHQWLRDRALGVEERRAKAATSWRLATGRYPGALCEYNAPVAGRAKLGLASLVLRYTDPGEARRVLQDLIQNHKDETDHLGQPLPTVAEALLEGLK
jgi:alkylhydroperoxidase/carboxymuconolactone decarboxylase family protein YurZ